MRHILPKLMIVLFIVAGMAACAPRDEKIYIPPHRYRQARLLYDMVGSLELTKAALRDAGWREGEIREAEYRLIKQFHLEDPYEAAPAQTVDL